MPHPKSGYLNSRGEKVPSVTTVIGRFKESGGLIQWAYNLGKSGGDLNAARQAACDAGTCCHQMIDDRVHGREFDVSKFPPEIVVTARHAFTGYLAWEAQSFLRVTASEEGLVSEKYQFGGTLDAVMVHGERSLIDWKTSNSVYADYCMQLAAYGILWEENHPDKPITGGYHLLRLSKPNNPGDPVSFHHHHWSDLSIAAEMFLSLRKAFDLDKRVRKLL